MSNMLSLHPYEISLWEDVFVKKNKYDEATNSVVVDSYFEERKIAILGSNTMDTPIRAHDAQYIKNINGSSTLVFTLYYQYYDNDKEEIVRNPLVDLLFNERKVKLRFEEEGREDYWHDFIIKDIQEDSTKYTYTYTATDLFINELAKNGFKLTFDTDLENNNGSHTELARQILKETDWNVIPTEEESKNPEFKEYKDPLNNEYSDLLRQKKVEPLYEIKLNKSLNATLCDPIRDKGFPKNITIPEGEVILLFHNTVEIQATDNKLVQFIYRKDGNYKVDSEYIIVNAPNYQLATGQSISWNNGIPNFTSTTALLISERYSGERLVWNVLTDTDLTIGQHVTQYKDKYNRTYNGYTTSEYVVSSMVQSFVTNGKNFSGLEGWAYENGGTITSGIAPDPRNYNNLETLSQEVKFTPYLLIKNGTTNSGFLDNAKIINNIGAGEKYTVRAVFETNREAFLPGYTGSSTNETITVQIVKGENIYLNCKDIESNGEPVTGKFELPLSFADLTDSEKPVLIKILCNPNTPILLVSLEIFKYEVDEIGNQLFPGVSATSKIKTKYYIYDPETNKDNRPEEYRYAYVGYDPSEAGFYNKYDNTFNKIRSITASKSNRFNLIQEVCETFECWADFVINHDEDGRIKRDKNGLYEKYVIFKEFIGQNNSRGFRYGINLNGIQRTVDSDQIVTKLIVEHNSNEYGTDGICTIARAVNNISGDTAIYDFSYYTNTGLLNANEVNNDLYGYVSGEPEFDESEKEKITKFELTQPQGYLGYFSKLAKYNSYIDALSNQQAALGLSLSQIDSSKQISEVNKISFDSKYTEALDTFNQYFGVTYDQFSTDATIRKQVLTRAEKDQKALDIITQIQSLNITNNYYNSLFGAAEKEYKRTKKLYDIATDNLKFIENLKLDLDKEFYQKYSRFIQEGSWISEDYYNDDWYYFDALSVLRISAHPQITYTINVIDLSSLEEYSNYQFAIGDKTYVEDVEFFGYSDFNTKTPFRKEVVVSEVTWNLDSPEQNQIKVQNYKTQFEDLFQRITATTQAVQYSTGSYAKAASVVTNNRTIDSDTLQNSFDNNAIIIANARDQSVVWNETGISITNLRNPNQIVRLVSNGILLSSDGGSTWKTGISASGINTKYLTTGQIDASRINIIGGEAGSGFSSFRWDNKGLTSYWWDSNGYDFNRFTRFDRFGLYGITGAAVDDFDVGLANAISEGGDDSSQRDAGLNFIKQNSDFGVTWDGFFIKSNHRGDTNPNSGHIEITPQDDFRVLDNEGRERIRIGLLGFYSKIVETIDETTGEKIQIEVQRPKYGMRLSGVEGDSSDPSAITMPVLESLSDGNLFLQNKMVIGPRDYNPRVQFGIVNTWQGNEGDLASIDIPDRFKPEPEDHYSKILSINDLKGNENIRIYDTGLLWAKNAYIEGHIEATSGKIGNVTIEEVQNTVEDKGVAIENLTGPILRKDSKGKFSPNTMSFKPILKDSQAQGQFYWEYYDSATRKFCEVSKTYLGPYVDESTGENKVGDGILHLDATYMKDKFDPSGTFTLRVTTNVDSENTYQNTTLISLVEQVSEKDINSDIYEIRLSTNEILKFYETSEELKYSPEEFYIYGVKTKAGESIYLNNEAEQRLEVFVRDKDYNSYSLTKKDGSTEEDNFFKQFIKYKEIAGNGGWYFNSSELFRDHSKDIGFEKSTNGESTNDEIINSILTNEEGPFVLFFRIIDKDGKKVFTENKVIIRYGNGNESAKLSVNSTNIIAAINNQKLKFSAEGLTILNGGLSIKKIINNPDTPGEDYEQLLYFNTNGDLYIKGNGEFNGTVIANGGEFNGDINAYGNIILGKKNEGNSSENEIIGTISSANFNQNNGTGFQIDGNGNIIANSIKLGAGAEIERYLKFESFSNKDQSGDKYISWLFNPKYSEEMTEVKNGFIVLERDGNPKTTLFSLTTDGKLRLGDEDNHIEMNGIDKTIESSSYKSIYKGWKISNDVSIFNHIKATRATIETAVFKYGEVQAIGGILVVRPSSTIKKITKDEKDNEYIITVEDSTGFNINSYCFFEIDDDEDAFYKNKVYLQVLEEPKVGEKDIRVKTVNVINNKVQNYNLEENKTDLIGKPIINVGSQNSVGIGINSSANDITVASNSISVFQTNITKKDEIIESIDLAPKIIMGRFKDKYEEGPGLIQNYGERLRGTYGLYVENILATGAIISENEYVDEGRKKKISAGLDTNSEASLDNLPEADKKKFFPTVQKLGRIVLWAGAQGNTAKDIEAANFKVDCYGNFYANSGYFNGTIISNSQIGASTLRTPEIIGTNKEKDENGPGLIIRKVDEGIHFRSSSSDDAKDKLKFRIDKNVVSVEDDIPFDARYIFIHRPHQVDPETPISTLIKDNQFNYVQQESFFEPNEIDPKILEEAEWNYLSSIYYDNNIKIGKSPSGKENYFSFGELNKNNNQIRNISNLTLEIQHNLILGKTNKLNDIMYYEQKTDGYDLFVLRE